ncbi:MAG: TrbC/VirB2 family protein [Candidatus Altiarchaeales archaeon]|nr:TrbC/VirB2 family protein [Candidatus Altiarchaeales archaeon]
MDKKRILKYMGNARVRMLMILVFLALFSVTAFGTGGTGTEHKAAYAIACLLCRIMQIFLLIVGVLATLVIIIGGIKWIGSGEDPEARTQAKSTIIHAIIGIIIVMVAGYVVSWIVSSFGGIRIADPIDAVTGCSKICAGF